MTPATTDAARISKAQLFARLGYKPHAGQIEVHRSRASRRVLIAGVRWGKSRVAAFESISALLEPKVSALGWIVAPTFELADIVFGIVVEVLAERLPHRVIEYSVSERRILVRNLGGGSSELRAKSADTPTTLLGQGLDFLVIDEAARLPSTIWFGYLSQRLIDHKGWALLISTPQGRSWLYRLWKRGQDGKDLDFESWSRPSSENPSLSPELLEAERRRLASWVFAQEYGGEFVGAIEDPDEPDDWHESGMHCKLYLPR